MDFHAVREVYSDPTGEAGNIVVIENGLHLWNVTINAGISEEVTIGHTADLHFNYCNQQDIDKADPVIMSTLAHRKWLANAGSVPNARRSLAFLHETTDQVVVNGDTLDYLSHGAMEIMQREVWDKYPDIIATVGGHELSMQMEGTVRETLPRSALLTRVAEFWKHDIFYTSRLIKGKVLIVAVLNDLARFTADQVSRFTEDLKSARENGYVVLLFGHEPFRTNNPEDRSVTVEDILIRGDTSGFPLNLCDYGKNDDETKAFNSLILNNADIIRGVFSGHEHNSMFHRIVGKDRNGATMMIPHFIITTNACDQGHVMRICVK